MLLLHAWETFYVIVGSSAAALTGLQFVVIALNKETRLPSDTGAVSAFATPNVVHFCAVLTISALMTMPGHAALSLSICLAVLGAAGVAYSLNTARLARRQTGYEPVLEDWLFHVGFPILSYNGRDFGTLNVEVAREMLAKARVAVVGEDVGGTFGRKLVYRIDTGAAMMTRLSK